MSGFVINPYIMAAAGGGTTTKYRVVIAEFDSENLCECSESSTYLIVEDDDSVTVGSLGQGAALSPSVNDWISITDASSDTQCAKVTAINQTGTAVGITETAYLDCDDCNASELICEEEICLLPHMLVKFKDGSLVKVNDLKIGDLIHTPDGYTEVVELIKDHLRSGYYIIEDELHISDDHPILIDGKMTRAKEYLGTKLYVKEATSTVYVGTVTETFNVYCKNNVYTVSGQYKR